MDSFLRGFTWGGLSALLGSIALLYALNMLGLIGFTLIQVPEFQQLLSWTYRNLGLSILPFSLTLWLFGLSIARLRRWIAEERPLAQVAQVDHLCDIWTGLFFGIGVIWTAIGMRSALVHALGEPETTAVEGAFSLLRRLVDGGILIALSTTIIGGIGGYLMRVTKACLVGNELRGYYNRAAESQDSAILNQLAAIEAHLSHLSNRSSSNANNGHADNGNAHTGATRAPGDSDHESEPMGNY